LWIAVNSLARLLQKPYDLNLKRRVEMAKIPEMTYRTLGRTGLQVSRVGLGSGGPSRLGKARGGDAALVERLVKQAVDLGINLIDTAPGYETEAFLGAALSSIRDPVYLATKVWCYPPGDDKDLHARPLTDPAHVFQSVEQSLRDLRTEAIDLLQLHGARPPSLPLIIEHLVPAMIRLQEQGKVRFLGATESPGNDSTQDMAALVCPSGVFDTIMIQYSIFDQEAERRTFPLVQEHDIGVLGMCAARGAFTDPEILGQVLERLDPDGGNLDFLLRGPIRSFADAAYRFAAAQENIHTLLVGTGNPAHLLESTAAILGTPLPAEHLQLLKKRFGHLNGDILWPEYH
jgi:aryl-alcohol dehydrogenase-like predicted oxidoreductase